MTREEAINILNQEVCSSKKLEAIKMAIKALSVDYDGMVKEIEKKIALAESENKPGFATITWDDFKIAGMKTVLEIVKKHVESKEK